MKKQQKKITKNIKSRKGLSELFGQTAQFRAIVGRPSMTSWKSDGLRQETLELKAIYCLDNPGRLLADHVWVKMADFENRDIIDSILKNQRYTREAQKIVFSGTVYGYSEPLGGRGFHGFGGFRYSIGNMELLREPAVA